jgi:hypothetical protein
LEAATSLDLGRHDPQQRRAPLWQSSVIVSVLSGVHPSNPNVFETMREPGLSARNYGCRFSMVWGRRKSAKAVAFEIPPRTCRLDERGLAADTFLRRSSATTRPSSGIFDADRARRAGRRDDVAAVAGSEIHHEVLRRHVGVEHLLNEGLWCRHPDDTFRLTAWA